MESLENGVEELKRHSDIRASRAPRLDLDKYRPYLSELRVTDEEAAEFLTAMWSIMCVCVDLGLGLETVLTGCAPLEKATDGKEVGLQSGCTPTNTTSAAHDPAERRNGHED